MAKPVDLGRGLPFTVLASICIVVTALYFAQAVLIPLVLAILITYLLSPIASRLERCRLGRVPSIILVVFVFLCLILFLGWVLKTQFIEIADKVPNYQKEIHNKINQIKASRHGVGAATIKVVKTIEEAAQAPATRPPPIPSTTTATTKVPIAPATRSSHPPEPGHSGVPSVSPQNPLPVRNVPEEPLPMDTLTQIVERLVHPVITAGIVLVFVFFMLLYREDLRDRVIRLTSRKKLQVTIQIVDETSRRISHYLLAQSLINSFYGFFIGLGLWIIGLTLGRQEGGFPNVLLWGLLTGILRFIPYFGPWLGAAFPLMLAFGMFPGYSVLVAVLLLFIGLELLVSQFVEPFLYGSSTGISAMAILVAALFWASIWGPIGLLLSTPLTVMLAVLGRYIPQLNFLYILLGDEPPLELHERLYQRLVAQDYEEVMELAQDFLKKDSLEKLYGTVFIPALGMAEEDRHYGRLEEEQFKSIGHTLRDIIEELGDQERPESAASAGEPKVNILCLPATDEADEAACVMLGQLLEFHGYHVFLGSTTLLAAEKINLVEEHQARIICISAFPANLIARYRYLCKRLLEKYSDLHVVVSLWNMQGDMTRIQNRFGSMGDLHLVTSLSQARQAIDSIAKTHFPVKK